MIEIRNITETMKYVGGGGNLKVAIFDLDDTLYGEKEYVRSGYRAVAHILDQVEDAEKKLWAAFENKKNAIDEVLYSEGIFTEELKQNCLKAYRFHEPDIHFYDGVPEMLTALRGMGLKLGIITDGRPEGQRAKIRALAIEKYVDHIIVTDELGSIRFRKPDETAFRLMREKMNVEYADMCYVGDNIGKDFIAPEKLGMTSIWFRNVDGLKGS